MYAKTLLVGALAALSFASPIEEARADAAAKPQQNFNVSKFVFGCTTTCDWYFSVTISPNSQHFPAVKKEIKCQGSTAIKNFKQASKTCAKISDTQSLVTYIDSNNNLRLKYEVQEPSAGATYWYEGATHVNAETSGKPQSKTFVVPVSKASAIA